MKFLSKFPGLAKDQLQIREILSSGQRFLIISRNEGLGDLLFAIAHSWLYCKKTGRTLIIDLADSRYLEDKEENAASVLIRFPTHYDGVRILTPHRFSWNLRTVLASTPLVRMMFQFHPPLFAYFQAVMRIFRIPIRNQRLYTENEEKREKSLIKTGKNPWQKFIFFRGCHWEHRAEIAGFLRAVAPAQDLSNRLDSLVQSLGGSFIGIHVCYYDSKLPNSRHSKHWSDFQSSIDEICKRIANARKIAGRELPIFLATDSPQVVLALSQHHPAIVTLGKTFADPAKAELHYSNVLDKGKDAILEMFALCHSEVLIRFPQSRSWFSDLAASRCATVIDE